MGIHTGNQRGAVLVTGLMLLAVIAMVSTGAHLAATGNVKMSAGYRDSKIALYAAEAGIQEARARLRGSPSAAAYAGDPASGSDPLWSAYILTSSGWQTTDDPRYNAAYHNYIPTGASKTNTTVTANSLQSPVEMDYFVKIRHKREYDAEQAGHSTAAPHYYDGDGSTGTHTAASPGNIVYFGYGNPASPTTAVHFTTGGSTDRRPVEIITAYGRRGKARKIVEVEVVRHPGPPVNSTLYSKGDVTINGASGFISGEDSCGIAAPLPPVYALSPAVVIENPAPTYEGSPAAAVTGPDDIDIDGIIAGLKDSATEIITSDQNGTDYGTSSDFVVAYSNPDGFQPPGLDMRNITGYGILLVEGDLKMSGGFDWNGLVLVTGTLTFNGGGSGINIRGAVLANQTVDINGGLDLRYDRCMIDNAMSGQAVRTVSWRLVY